MTWHSNTTICLKLTNQCVLSMCTLLNVIGARVLLPLWSDCPHHPSSMEAELTVLQAAWREHAHRARRTLSGVILQLTGRSDPSLAHALPTVNETLREEVVRVTCSRARHTQMPMCARTQEVDRNTKSHYRLSIYCWPEADSVRHDRVSSPSHEIRGAWQRFHMR